MLVEFTETDVMTPLTFTGKVTGTRYRFGSDDDNKVRWVRHADVAPLLTYGSFKMYNEVDGGPLVAAGPPR